MPKMIVGAAAIALALAAPARAQEMVSAADAGAPARPRAVSSSLPLPEPPADVALPRPPRPGPPALASPGPGKERGFRRGAAVVGAAPSGAAAPTAPPAVSTASRSGSAIRPRPGGPAALATGPDVLLANAVRPRTRQLAEAMLALQNAIVRRCMHDTGATERALRRAFRASVAAAGALSMLSFAGPQSAEARRRLLTPVAGAIGGRASLDALARASAEPPRSPVRLSRLGAPLSGLPALERIVLDRRPIAGASWASRCRLALPMAAQARAVVLDLSRAWQMEALPPHWRGSGHEEAVAADMRLRDLLKGLASAVEALVVDLEAYVRQPADNAALPFADPMHAALFLDATAAAIADQTVVLGTIVSDRPDVAVLLAHARRSLSQGRRALAASSADDRPRTTLLSPFLAARVDLLVRVPEALD